MVIQEPAPRPFTYPYSCDKPESAEQDNLCMQRRSLQVAKQAADATDSQAKWAMATFFVGIAGTLGVVGTLIFTAIAAYAAKRGAEAAGTAAGVAIKAMTDLERPYIFAFGVGKISHFDGEWEGPMVDFSIANFGRLPAIVENTEIITARSDSDLIARGDVTVCGRLPASSVISAGERMEGLDFSLTKYEEFLVGERFGAEINPRNRQGEPPTGYYLKFGQAPIIVRIVVKYRGVSTVGHETSSCWILREGKAAFQQYGGADYNYWK